MSHKFIIFTSGAPSILTLGPRLHYFELNIYSPYLLLLATCDDLDAVPVVKTVQNFRDLSDVSVDFNCHLTRQVAGDLMAQEHRGF